MRTAPTLWCALRVTGSSCSSGGLPSTARSALATVRASSPSLPPVSARTPWSVTTYTMSALSGCVGKRRMRRTSRSVPRARPSASTSKRPPSAARSNRLRSTREKANRSTRVRIGGKHAPSPMPSRIACTNGPNGIHGAIGAMPRYAARITAARVVAPAAGSSPWRAIRRPSSSMENRSTNSSWHEITRARERRPRGARARARRAHRVRAGARRGSRRCRGSGARGW